MGFPSAFPICPKTLGAQIGLYRTDFRWRIEVDVFSLDPKLLFQLRSGKIIGCRHKIFLSKLDDNRSRHHKMFWLETAEEKFEFNALSPLESREEDFQRRKLDEFENKIHSLKQLKGNWESLFNMDWTEAHSIDGGTTRCYPMSRIAICCHDT
eukprot:scaffold7965_cov106-Cylindrotheca_fusiformis.AAC.1